MIAVDVMAVMGAASAHIAGDAAFHVTKAERQRYINAAKELREARAAVAELISAAKEHHNAYAGMVSGTRAFNRKIDASRRLEAALALCSGDVS